MFCLNTVPLSVMYATHPLSRSHRTWITKKKPVAIPPARSWYLDQWEFVPLTTNFSHCKTRYNWTIFFSDSDRSISKVIFLLLWKTLMNKTLWLIYGEVFFFSYQCSFICIELLLISGLTERWENLSHKAEEAQRASALQREMAAMLLEFRAANERLISHEIIVEPAHILEESISQITVSTKI